MNAEDSSTALASWPALRTGLSVLRHLSLAFFLILMSALDLLLAGIAGFEIPLGERCLQKKTG